MYLIRVPRIRFNSAQYSNLGTVLQLYRGLSQEFTSHGTVAVRTAKAWESPHAGTVPDLLPFTLNLAPLKSAASFRLRHTMKW